MIAAEDVSLWSFVVGVRSGAVFISQKLVDCDNKCIAMTIEILRN